MSDQDSESKLHIDSDWKTEAAKEKEQLLEQEKASQEAPEGQASIFMELVNMLAVQATIGLSGYQGPEGESMAPNPALAKHYIDMLDAVEVKTKGNLSDDEGKMLGTVLHELRMQYVQAAQGGSAAPMGPA